VIAPRLALMTVSGAILAIGVTGCAQQAGTDDKEFQGEAARVANTVRDLDDAYTDEQSDDTGARTVCRTLLSKRLVAAYGGTKCEATAAKALKNSDPLQMDVRDVNITGNVATVRARLKLSDDEQRYDTLKLVQEGRTWKFDGSTTGKKQPENS
jgi:glutaredoxin-related protein